MKYHVLLRPEFNIRVCNVEADSREAAIDLAIEWLHKTEVMKDIRRATSMQWDEGDDTYVKFTELSEDLNYALVDVDGDTEFILSQWYQIHAGDGHWAEC